MSVCLKTEGATCRGNCIPINPDVKMEIGALCLYGRVLQRDVSRLLQYFLCYRVLARGVTTRQVCFRCTKSKGGVERPKEFGKGK